MNASISYQQLSLAWRPEGDSDRSFQLLLLVVLICMLLLAIVISTIKVPKPERVPKTQVSERIAKFIEQRPAPKPKPVPEPKSKAEPTPKLPLKQKIERQVTRQSEQKPLTQSQKRAREKASESGLLALGNELADLMDTSAIADQVRGSINQGADYRQVAEVDTESSSDVVARGSGGLRASQINALSNSQGLVSGSQLSVSEQAAVRQSLFSKDGPGANQPDAKRQTSQQTTQSATKTSRNETEITVTFERSKGKLYALYNRARRKNPNLKGRVVLQITISPSGKVTHIKIISSELNDLKLEQGLISRIKAFDFGVKEGKPVTVTFPIEFLPS